MTQVKGACTNSLKRRIGSKGGKVKMSKDRNWEGKGGLGATGGEMHRGSRITGGGGGWNYGVGIWI